MLYVYVLLLGGADSCSRTCMYMCLCLRSVALLGPIITLVPTSAIQTNLVPLTCIPDDVMVFSMALHVAELISPPPS